MKKYIVLIFSLFFFSLPSFANTELIKIADRFQAPWSLTIVKQSLYLVTEKSGNLVLLNRETNTRKKISHNLNVLEDGQGGLLDVMYHKDYVYVTYAENRGQGKTSTSAARAKFNESRLEFTNIFRAEPPINSGYHFGSRIVIKDDYVFLSAGERGGDSIAQDPTKHPGSIIRVHLDGSIPKDNPKFKGKSNWLPEIYQIGIRNVQGMALSPYDGEVYMTNHGARGGDWFGKVN
ncbi:MAG: PQQ-dependent sugar dehydrogenase, partial [Proteobacteria bacterium]|nr:PQQ-dependent sugar dehydrogenase [Pseudomonadota bacterium]